MDNLNSKSKEIARLQKVERGFFTEEDKLFKFPETTRSMSPMEKEMFFNRLKSIISKYEAVDG